MTLEQIIYANVASFVLIAIVYSHSKWDKIKSCYGMWFTKEYWTDYNTVEFVSLVFRISVIVPGLIFGIQIWWFFFLTLAASLTLIWASNKKLLPSLVGFNTIWVWLSCMVLAQHLVK